MEHPDGIARIESKRGRIATEPDGVNAGSSDIGQHGSQGNGIAVDIGEDRNAHGRAPGVVWFEARMVDAENQIPRWRSE
jgi:hypothetical protein